MKIIPLVYVFALCLLSTACEAGSSASVSSPVVKQPIHAATTLAPVTGVAGPASGDAARSAIESRESLSVPGVPKGVLEMGMDYAYLRRAVLAHGWTPVIDKKCKANVVGDDYKTLCAAHPGLQDCKVCDQMPELSECSVDGYCLMHFHQASTNQNMEVGTYGDTTGWSVNAKKSQLGVTGLTVTSPASH